jgi:alkylation response protein AidB-like acyl-CoA dehydrogenase
LLGGVAAATPAPRVAARLGDAASPDHPAAARLALATAVETYRRAAEETMQIHGGMGYTWDHDVHLHLKRAKGDEAVFGSGARNRARLADLVGF